MNHREFLQLLAIACSAGILPHRGHAAANDDAADLYAIPPFGNVRLLHFTDCHAQLLPIYFREPNVNTGIGEARGRAPHIVGEELLAHFDIAPGGIGSHAFTHLDFTEAARRYGKVGGFAHLRTLVSRLRGEVGAERTLLLDGGDTWQGSGTALWTRGRDMVDACNLLGVDVMTGHWEFTYLEEEVRAHVGTLNAEFVAQNLRVREDALFDGAEAFDEDTGHAFPPYAVKEVGGRRIAIIGQAFPYTPIANPQRFIPDWTFGIRDEDLQALVDEIRSSEKPDALVVLSHNGMDVDLKMASRVSGIDAILGGHTHDGGAGAGAGRERRRQDPRHQCGIERQVLGAARPRPRPRWRAGLSIPARSRLLQLPRRGPRDDGADRAHSRALRRPAGRGARGRGHAALPARELQRHLRPAHLRRPAHRRRRADLAVARIPLGDDHHPRTDGDDGTGARSDRDHLSRRPTYAR